MDVELGGQTIRRGESVIVILGSADRDPERFEEPDTLDLAARAREPALGFGRGSHFCLGAPLARLETEIALGTLLRRLPGLRLAISPEEFAGDRCRSSAASSRCRLPGTPSGGAAGLWRLRRAA